MTECNDSMYEWSICGNRYTVFQVRLMHSYTSIIERLLYNDLITVSVPFRISLSGVSYCFEKISRAFLGQLCFQALEPIRSTFCFGICYVFIWRDFKPEFLLNGKRP